jgi:3-(3-hydroxy-phenyl)propionate hydroxylase
VSARGEHGDALRERYLGTCGGAVYLMRPDQHVAARWETYDAEAVKAAVVKAIGG